MALISSQVPGTQGLAAGTDDLLVLLIGLARSWLPSGALSAPSRAARAEFVRGEDLPICPREPAC